MKDVKLVAHDKPLAFVDSAIPEASPNSVVVKILATPLLSYTRQYLRGELPYMYPQLPFTPGTDAIGMVYSVGENVHSIKVGMTVAVTPNWIAEESVSSPERVLIGLTGISANSQTMLTQYPNGTWREYGDFPASTIIPLESIRDFEATTLAVISKLIVPFGGLRRMGLAAGETVVINGASGSFGSGAVLAALALGANVILLGRNRDKLAAVADRFEPTGTRVKCVTATSDVQQNVQDIHAAFGHAPQKALCMVGQANTNSSSVSALQSLASGGQLVIMGSAVTELSIDYNQMLINNWEVKGLFMYTCEDYHALIVLIRSGAVDLSKIDKLCFTLTDIEKAIDKVGVSGSLEHVVLDLS